MGVEKGGRISLLLLQNKHSLLYSALCCKCNILYYSKGFFGHLKVIDKIKGLFS